MAGAHVFTVRFHLGGNWPSNPYALQGKGSIALEPEFVTVRGRAHLTFRLPKWVEHRLRVADIFNVRTEGPDLHFEVAGAKGKLSVGCTLQDADAAKRLAAMLPERQTEAFAQAERRRAEERARADAEHHTFHDRIDYWSPSTPVIWTLLALNIGIYLLMAWQRHKHGVPLTTAILSWGPGQGGQMDAVLRAYQLEPWGSNKSWLTMHGQPWRLVTSMFIHGFFLHLLLNMITLWQAGQLVERMFGSLRFLTLYLVAGVCGSLASALWQPLGNSVGASGAIFGVIGGLLAFMRREDSGIPPSVVKELRASVAPFLLFSLTVGVVYPHTDNACHLGGLVGGFVAGHLLARSLHMPGQGTEQRTT
jgi:rhomboid protease GluP